MKCILLIRNLLCNFRWYRNLFSNSEHSVLLSYTYLSFTTIFDVKYSYNIVKIIELFLFCEINAYFRSSVLQ